MRTLYRCYLILCYFISLDSLSSGDYKVEVFAGPENKKHSEFKSNDLTSLIEEDRQNRKSDYIPDIPITVDHENITDYIAGVIITNNSDSYIYAGRVPGLKQDPFGDSLNKIVRVPAHESVTIKHYTNDPGCSITKIARESDADRLIASGASLNKNDFFGKSGTETVYVLYPDKTDINQQEYEIETDSVDDLQIDGLEIDDLQIDAALCGNNHHGESPENKNEIAIYKSDKKETVVKKGWGNFLSTDKEINNAAKNRKIRGDSYRYKFIDPVNHSNDRTPGTPFSSNIISLNIGIGKTIYREFIKKHTKTYTVDTSS